MTAPDPVARLVALCIDAGDPRRLARFWADALRWGIDEEADPVALVPTDETSFTIVFRPVPEPKVGRNRIHLDLTSTSIEDQQESVARMIGLGASPVDVGQTDDEGHVVLADPEGNELCVIGPENGFLDGRPRLGALSCDGSRAVGLFWHEVLGWPLVWDQGEETAIGAPDGTGPFITWGGGPEIPKVGKNRLHLDIEAAGHLDAATDHLVALGATRLGFAAPDHIVLADPDGNELCLRSVGPR